MDQPVSAETAAAALNDKKIEALGGWRGGVLAGVREIIRGADTEIAEELKWTKTPVWSRGGIRLHG